MDTLGKILLENVGIDFYYCQYDGMQHRLDEVHGYVPNLDKYLDCVSKACCNKFIEVVEQGFSHFTIDETAFADIEDKFFDTAFFDITLSIGDPSNNTSDYDQMNSGIVNGKRHVEFCFDISDSDIISLTPTMLNSVAHELIHAYQDISSIEKSGMRLTDTFDMDRYVKITKTARFGQSQTAREFAFFLYNTEPSEVNAFIGEIKPALLSNKKFISGSKRAEEAIKETETYRRLMDCWRFLNQLEIITNEHEIDILLQTYNKIFGTTIKSYGKMLKKLRARVERFSNKMMEQASKIAYDIFSEKKQCIIH